MSRRRRLLSMVTAALAVLGLGFVVAVAARSLPGSTGDEPLLDFDFQVNFDLSPVFAWILLLVAVLGAVLFALGLRERQPRDFGTRRNLLGTLIGLILFVVIARWLRPAAEALLDEGAAVADSATEVMADDGVGTAGGWLFSILLAAILAAALTRIGLSIRTVTSPFEPDERSPAAAAPLPIRPASARRGLGDDPRSRILIAYEEFEDRLSRSGRPRDQAETTARHANRAAQELSLDADEVEGLVGHHARARFGSEPLTESEARAAEVSSARLRSGVP